MRAKKIFNKNNFQIFLASFLMLFLELLVIRLISTEIRIFAYISNLILLAVFIGSGWGMIIKEQYSLTLSAGFLFLLSVVVVFKYIVRLPNVEFNLFSGITEMLAPLSEAHIWGQTTTFLKQGLF